MTQSAVTPHRATSGLSRLRSILAAFAFVGVGLVSVLLLTDVNVALWRVGPWQLGLYVAGCILAGPAILRAPRPVMVWVGLAAIALAPLSLLLRIYGFVDLVSLRYHLEAGITGDSLWEARRAVVVVGASLAFLLLVTHHAGHLLGRTRWVAAAVALLLVGMNPVFGALVSSMAVSRASAALATRIAPPALAPTPDRPDLVILYLEGLEQGYANRDLFGDAYDPLRQLWPEATVFTDVAQIEGTGWSAAGMVSTQCGLPLLPNGGLFRNGLIAQKDYLIGHVCLGDVLEALGYRSRFVLGGEAIFAGIGEFYHDHGIPEQFERQDFHELYPAEEVDAARADWMLDDQIVFDMARRLYREGLASGQPQALIVETFGPHGPEHLLSRRCSPTGRALFVDDMRPAVRCLAEEVHEFVRFVQAEAGPRRTVVVLLSDHLGHDYRLRRLLADHPRRNTALLIDSGQEGGVVIDKPGSMIDVYPTILAFAGLADRDARGGLGVSLLSGEPTLVEELGLEGLNAQLRWDPAIREAIWAVPDAGSAAP